MCSRSPMVMHRLVQLVQASAPGYALANSLSVNGNHRSGALLHRISTPIAHKKWHSGFSAKCSPHEILRRAPLKFMHKRTTKGFVHKKQSISSFMTDCNSLHQLHQYPQLAHHTEIRGAPRPPVAIQ